MRKFKVGVIGAGAVAQHCHIPGYAAARNCVLAAIADPVARCLDEVEAKGFKFTRRYADYREMLSREKLEVVSICTPNYLHKQMALDCIAKGLTILLEKPVATTREDARAIAAAVRKKGVRLMVGFTHRFNALNRAAREALQAGRIGRPYMVRVRFAHMGPIPGWARTDWFYNPKMAGGGAMLDMAIHAFDLLHWYLGPVTAVQAKAATLRKPIEVEDNAVVLLEFAAPCLGYVEVGWTSPAGFCGVELMGDQGALCVDYGAGKTTLSAGTRKPSGESRVQTEVLAERPGDAWQAEMAYFTSRLESRAPFCAGIEAGVAALDVALAAYQSSRTGRRVTLAASKVAGSRLKRRIA